MKMKWNLIWERGQSHQQGELWGDGWVDRKWSRIISFFHSLSIIAWFLPLVWHVQTAAIIQLLQLQPQYFYIFPLTGYMAPAFQTDLSVCSSLHLSVYCNIFTTNAIFKVILCLVLYLYVTFLSLTHHFLDLCNHSFFQPSALFILFQHYLCQHFFPLYVYDLRLSPPLIPLLLISSAQSPVFCRRPKSSQNLLPNMKSWLSRVRYGLLLSMCQDILMCICVFLCWPQKAIQIRCGLWDNRPRRSAYLLCREKHSPVKCAGKQGCSCLTSHQTILLGTFVGTGSCCASALLCFILSGRTTSRKWRSDIIT